MLLRKMPPSKIVMLGMILVGAANAAQWFLQRHSGWGENAVDFASGVMQGIAIGTLLVGIWLQARSRRNDR